MVVVIENKLIPFKGFKAINLFGVIFVRKGARMTSTDFNHEAIHTAQMKELGYVFFYVLYLIEWLYRLCKSGNAYRNISFEREAYENEDDVLPLSQEALRPMEEISPKYKGTKTPTPFALIGVNRGDVRVVGSRTLAGGCCSEWVVSERSAQD